MKTKIFLFICSTIMLAACSSDLDNVTTGNIPGGGDDPDSGGGTATTDVTISGLTDFNVTFNTAAISGETDTETVPSYSTVTIDFSTSPATVTGVADGEASISGGDVTISTTKSYDYILSGSNTNGSLTLTNASSTKMTQSIHLNGVTLKNPDGAVINIAQKGTTYIVANNGTTNTITDGSRDNTVSGTGAVNDLKVKGAIFTKGKAVFSGAGSLKIYGYYKNGIDTKKNLEIRPLTNIYVELSDTIHKGSCLKCEETDAGDGMFIYGGVQNLNNPSYAGKGLSADGNLTISGGRCTAICTGNGMWDETDVSGAAGVKCDSVFTMKAGELWLKSTGSGGKGVNGDSILNFNGGTVHTLTTGSTYATTYNSEKYDSSPKGIKCDRKIYVTDGSIYVRATGTSDGSEGVEAKESFNQSGGTVMIYAADDALNAGYSGQTDQGDMSLARKIALGLVPKDAVADQGQINVSGGTLYCYSTSNDAIDSNGYITISGGNVCAFGTTGNGAETSIDCDNDSRFSVTGGNIFGVGSAAPNTPSKACSQCYAITSFSANANTEYTLQSSDGTKIMTVTVPQNYSNKALVVSSPNMKTNTTYTIGTTSFTTGSSYITNSYGSGMGGGGNQPGGQPGGNPGGQPGGH